MKGYFPEPKYFGRRMEVELDLVDLKNATCVDT